MIAHRNARQRRPQSCPRRQPLVEHLEHRTLLSGNVAAAQAGTLLTLTGDDASNQIKVYSPAPNVVVVQGESYTKVNHSYSSRTFYGVEQIEAQFNGGNDSFKAVNLCLSATFRLEPSSDPMEPADIYVPGFASLFVDGGTGDDCILVECSTIRSTDTAQVTLAGEILLPGQSSSGNDVIEVSDSTVHAEGGMAPSATLAIVGEQNSGGTVSCGNDSINVNGTSVAAVGDADSSAAANVIIYGDQNFAGGTFDDDNDPETDPIPVPTSSIGIGNDCISLFGNTVIAKDGQDNGAAVQIFGDFNTAIGDGTTPATAEIGSGKDDITVACTNVSAKDGAASNQAILAITGDQNAALGEDASAEIGVGNDDICVSSADVTTDGDAGSTNITSLSIVGDDNFASGVNAVANICGGNDSISVTGSTFSAGGGIRNSVGNIPSAPAEILGDRNVVGGTGTASIGGGNDCISVCDTTFSACGDAAGNTAFVRISGDQNITPPPTNPTGIASIGGGNDRLSVDDTCVSTSGAASGNTSQLEFLGDGELGGTFRGQIGGGNDTMSLTDSDISANGLASTNNAAALILGDDSTLGANVTAAEGNDRVSVLCLRIEGTTNANMQFHTAKGCDFAEIRNSQFFFAGVSTGDDTDIDNDDLWFTGNHFTRADLRLGGGNDDLWFTGNTFLLPTTADGGPGHDRLVANSNTGPGTATRFEEVNGMPSLLPVVLIP